MNLIQKFAYNPFTKMIQAIAPGGVSLKIAQTESGIYTPGASSLTNCTVSPQQCLYSSVGNVVTVSGALNVDTSLNDYNFQITLPIPSNFTSALDAAGTGSRKQGGDYGDSSIIQASPANDTLYFEGYGTDLDNETLLFTCQYIIK